MDEAGPGPPGPRSLKAALGRLLASLVLAVGLVGASASASAALAPPGVFSLKASNGYSLTVWSEIPREGRSGEALLILQSPHAAVVYVTPATVTETSIEATLGALGHIDVDFKPSGKPRRQRSSCGAGPAKFDAGAYEGTIDFTGEEGYTEVHARRAAGDLQFVLDVVCPGSSGSGGSVPGVPGAELRARRRGPGPRLSFGAITNTPDSRPGFEASIDEARGRIRISRALEIRAPAGSFTYDPSIASATVRPPAPFSGVAVYRRHASPARQWTGSLSVDFPGRSNVSLTGAAFRAGLSRSRWEPPAP